MLERERRPDLHWSYSATMVADVQPSMLLAAPAGSGWKLGQWEQPSALRYCGPDSLYKLTALGLLSTRSKSHLPST